MSSRACSGMLPASEKGTGESDRRERGKRPTRAPGTAGRADPTPTPGRVAGGHERGSGAAPISRRSRIVLAPTRPVRVVKGVGHDPRDRLPADAHPHRAVQTRDYAWLSARDLAAPRYEIRSDVVASSVCRS
jgi:hypothetical protein